MALVVLVAAGALLFDIIRVGAGYDEAAWRRTLSVELATRPVNDVWMLTGATAAALLGLWLIIVALTAGHRHLLPMASKAGGRSRFQAALKRDSAALILRDAALSVPGVTRAKIQVRHRRINALAQVRFRDPEKVRHELVDTLDEERDSLGLARPPRISVWVRRQPHDRRPW
ncbi:DUF6286 domain-containing protein [Kitasatospora sp. NPDC056138]|uniref:DUF6286 domain-containing protein n=1 Tax=Kitasatospora sp. NPDC056138 TaxID=3345724 RepID=UPI0035DBE826